MSELREKIARALHRQATDDGEVHVLWGGVSEHEEEVAEWLPFADAVLAVLADLPESVIERAARWMYDEYTAVLPDAWERDEFGREEWRVDARDLLRAAFGGEQS